MSFAAESMERLKLAHDRLHEVIRERDELLEALGEAIIQVQKDALKLGNSVHGRYLQTLADKWTAVFNRATTSTERDAS